jgi:hypothetical protein
VESPDVAGEGGLRLHHALQLHHGPLRARRFAAPALHTDLHRRLFASLPFLSPAEQSRGERFGCDSQANVVGLELDPFSRFQDWRQSAGRFPALFRFSHGWFCFSSRQRRMRQHSQQPTVLVIMQTQDLVLWGRMTKTISLNNLYKKYIMFF